MSGNEKGRRWQEVSLSALGGVRVGNAQDTAAGTGVTVLLFPDGAHVGADLSDGSTSRESACLSSLASPAMVNAIVLSGGSVYGLAAGDGVADWLEVHGMGCDTGIAPIPIVAQSCLYDLAYGSPDIRPDAAMGWAACEAAWACEPVTSGLFGAGAGATVGKLCGMRRSMKSGLGVYAAEANGLIVAAIVAVNALGDIYDKRTGRKIAGLLTPDRKAFSDTLAEWHANGKPADIGVCTSATIGAVLTNGLLDKAQLAKLASMARSAYAHCIRPTGTMADGDAVYAASVGVRPVDISMAGVLASEVMAEAIRRAVTTSHMADAEFLAGCWPHDEALGSSFKKS